MNRIKLTDSLINYSAGRRKATSPEWLPFTGTLQAKGGIIRDLVTIGFQIKRTGIDVLSFRYAYKHNGRKKNITLGQFPGISVAQARELIKTIAKKVAYGNDPLAEKQAILVKQDNTLQSYLDHEYALHMERAIAGKDYIAVIKNHWPELLKKPLTDINKTDLVKWVQSQMTRYNANEYGYSSDSIKKRYSALKSLLSHAVRNQVITQNPFDLMAKLEFHRDESTQQQAKRTYLEIEQQQSLLASIDAYDEKLRAERRNSRKHGKPYLPDLDDVAFASHHKPMMLILYYMGLRTGDVLSLEWTHVIDTPFTCNITKVLEKTRRKVKSPFILPIPPQVRDMLRLWREQQGNPTTGLVFPNPSTGKRFEKQCLKRCWKWIRTDAGFHEDLQLYTLRHNFISWLVMQGTPLKAVASMAGHKTTTMIDLHYSHLAKGTTQQASNDFAKLLMSEKV